MLINGLDQMYLMWSGEKKARHASPVNFDVMTVLLGVGCTIMIKASESEKKKEFPVFKSCCCSS